MSDLSVNVNRNDIVISKPSSGLSVTYRRTGRVLVALDSRGTDLPCSSVERLAQLIKTPRGGGVGNHLGAKILIRGVAAFSGHKRRPR